MWRRTRWILLVLLVLLVGGAIAIALIEQPKLDDADRAVDTRWDTLRAPLDERYLLLQDALNAFSAGGGGERAVTKDLGAALSRWTRARHAKDAIAEVSAADELEAQATRLLVNAGGARFQGNAALAAALQSFNGHLPQPDAVAAYNRAVQSYQDERDSLLGAPVARLLGFHERPTFALGG